MQESGIFAVLAGAFSFRQTLRGLPASAPGASTLAEFSRTFCIVHVAGYSTTYAGGFFAMRSLGVMRGSCGILRKRAI
jgi:hypothetical protein